MHIELTTDNHIEGSDELTQEINDLLERVMRRFADQITRIEVHLNDENSHKGGDADKRCMMEARLSGHQPIAVTHFAGSIHQSLDGAADKLRAAVERRIGRIRDKKGDVSFSGE